MFSELQINQLCNVSAFVRHVGEIKTFMNSRGEGALFNIDLEDANGDRVRATMFSTPSDVQASWEKLSGSTNQSIHLTNCRVKQPNAKFSSDRIELQLSKNTAISEGKKCRLWFDGTPDDVQSRGEGGAQGEEGLVGMLGWMGEGSTTTMIVAMAATDRFSVFSMKMTKIEQFTYISLQTTLPYALKYNSDIPQDIPGV